MKRHVQQPGIRKWSGDDLLELQKESLTILDQFFEQYGNVVIKGCAIDVASGIISAGLVGLSGKDTEGNDTYKVCPFPEKTGVNVFPVYLALKFTEITRDYEDAVVRPIAYQYEAELLSVKPTDRPYLELSEGSKALFTDVIQDELHRFISDDDRNKWDKKASANHTHPVASSDKAGFMSVADREKINKLGAVNNYPEGETVDGKIEVLSSRTYIPTFETEPTENTLTFQYAGKEYNFSIGQQCRVFDTKSKDYAFYQLYNITSEKKADWRQAGSDGSAFFETVKINLSSNQGVGDTALNGATITLKYSGQQTDLVWSGEELSASIPMSVGYEIIAGSIDGYAAPEIQKNVAVGGGKRQINLVYSTEKVTINVSANDGADCSDRMVQVINTANSQLVGTGKGSPVVIKVPFGISYKIKVDNFPGYLTPQEQTYTANSAIRSISFQYEKIVDASIVFDKSISDPSNITGDINSGVIATILSKFRRCLCKKTAEGQVTIAYLKDTDSNYYEDGTAAQLNGNEGDVMVDFPEFYYKWEQVDANKFRYRFAEYNVDGTFKHVPRSLVGAYKAYQTGNKLYSRSGVAPTTNTTYTNFASYASARGAGYRLIDFQQHCVIAFMLYAKYGNRNLQAVLGAGGAINNPATTTGTTNQKGNRDTANETSGYVNGLGLEGVFGGQHEWVQNVSIQDRVWIVTDPDGTQRNVNAGTESGWITRISAETGPYFDMVPTAVGGSETTHYSDCYYQETGGPFCLLRSFYSSHTNGGVACSGALYAASYSGTAFGSRLAFRGVIREASSVSAFKSLSVL